MQLTHNIEVVLCSSQRYRDPTKVAEKREKEDYDVFYVQFELEGILYWLILDGHHGYDAARADSEPALFYVWKEKQNELDAMELDDFLEKNKIDSPYYNLETMEDLW